MKRNILNLIGIITIFSFALISCKNNTDQRARLEVRLTDDPADYDAVLIDIRDVQINVTGDDKNGWQSLTGVHAGIYNLLDLVNDKDTLLANADIPSGRLHQIRLVLGSNNSVVVDGVTIALETPSAQQSGLKLNIQQDVTGGILYKVLLDFEAAKSVVKTGNGKYILKPVIRTVMQAVGGSLSGYVLPPNVLTAVFALQGTDTVASTFTGANGGYLIKGLTAGTYSVVYLPTDTTYKQQVKTGISITTGQVTVADTVKLLH
jgi:hypothetical protein